jgi:hypothetical protein
MAGIGPATTVTPAMAEVEAAAGTTEPAQAMVDEDDGRVMIDEHQGRGAAPQ